MTIYLKLWTKFWGLKMIKITKSEKPPVLIDNEVNWTTEYLALIAGEEGIPQAARFRYRHEQIKRALRAETHDKCIFCESKISHTFPGETDHIIPCSKDPTKIVDWHNLGYVCKECNRKKSDYHDPAVPLLNPFVDDPEKHLLFLGPLVIARTGDLRGEVTVSRLELTRTALIERKIERIEKVKALLDRANMFPEGEAREFIVRQAKEEASEDREYSATVKSYLLQEAV